MRIKKGQIAKLRPCEDRYQNYLNTAGDKDRSLQEFLELDTITYLDKIWVCIRLMSKRQQAAWAGLCAMSVYPDWQARYPNNLAVKSCLDALVTWVNKPTKKNLNLLISARSNAAAATVYAANAAATNAAPYVVVYAAYAATYAAATAYATTDDAAYAASYAAAAYAAYAADVDYVAELQLPYIIEIFENGEVK